MSTDITQNPAERLAAIQARHDAATGESWHWSGNTDTGEPYLATWIPGLGRCSVLAIGTENRSKTDRHADDVRSYARECGEDPEEMVHDWATDRYDEPIKEPRLWFFSDLMADPARKHVVYEVAPTATTREDPKVYRADITDIRHPDAQFIAHAREDVPWLLERVRQLEAAESALASVRSLARSWSGRHDLLMTGDSAAHDIEAALANPKTTAGAAVTTEGGTDA